MNNFGGYDDSTSWDSIKTPSGRPDDARIARRLQYAEENPMSQNIADIKIDVDESIPRQYYEEVEKGAAIVREKLEQKLRDEEKKRHDEARQHREQEIRATNQLAAAQRQLEIERRMPIPAPVYVNDYRPLYRRIFDWGVDYIPSYYSAFKREQARRLLEKLLTEQIKKTRDEDELKYIIKKFISEFDKTENRPKFVEKSSRKSVKQSPRKSAKKSVGRSPRKSAKKSVRQLPRKSAKKSVKRSPKKSAKVAKKSVRRLKK